MVGPEVGIWPDVQQFQVGEVVGQDSGRRSATDKEIHLFPEPFRPDSDVAIHVLAAFAESAVRAALLDGYRLDRDLSFWLTPKDPTWKAAVGLLPQVVDSQDHELVVAPPYKVVLINLAPTRWDNRDLPKNLLVPMWPCPELRVIREAAPRPLESWPEDAEGLLDLAAEANAEIQAVAGTRLDELLEATERWIKELPDRLAQWVKLLDDWRNDDLINDPFEGACDELDTLERSLHLLDDVAQRSTFDLSLPPVVSTFRAASFRLVVVDAAVHLALSDIRPKVRDAYRKRKEIEARQKERDEAWAWTWANGSSRLRMAAEAKVLDTAMGIYRDERLAEERPGWMWVMHSDVGMLQKKGVNPSEEALFALLEARKRDPGVYIGYHEKSGRQVLVGHLLNRPIWTPVEEDWGGEDWLENRTGRVVSVLDVFPPPRPQRLLAEDEEPF